MLQVSVFLFFAVILPRCVKLVPDVMCYSQILEFNFRHLVVCLKVYAQFLSSVFI